MCELREQKGQMFSTSRKWQYQFLSDEDGKKQTSEPQIYCTIRVCEEITLKGISGQHAMKWGIVQL